MHISEERLEPIQGGLVYDLRAQNVKFVAPIKEQICLEYLGPMGHIPGDWRPIWDTGGLNLKSVFLF